MIENEIAGLTSVKTQFGLLVKFSITRKNEQHMERYFKQSEPVILYRNNEAMINDVVIKRKAKIGVVSGVISSTESESVESEGFHFFRFRLRLRHLRSREYYTVGFGSRSGRTKQSQGPKSSIVIGLFYRFCFRLRQSCLHEIVSDGVTRRIGVLLPIFH